ncbi:MAG: transporter substrate-binding domain-containing protein [Microbacterium sp.]|uniref:transporter substrate-binding domain-containing protein n=1 Tax=Microbacterium sp. TaxID=51671 RepID=UPI0039E47B37
MASVSPSQRGVRRSLTVAGAALAAVALLAGCSQTSADDTSESASDESSKSELFDMLPQSVKDSGKVVIASDASFGPPWVFHPEEDPEQWQGIDVDMSDHLFKEVFGVEVERLEMPFDGIIPALKAGKFDVVVNGMTASAERQEQIDQVYVINSDTGIVVAEGNPKGVQEWEDLCGLVAATISGTNEQHLLEELAAECPADKPLEVLPFPTATAQTLAVTSGRADALIGGYATFTYLDENELPSFDGLELLDVIVQSNPLGYGSSKAVPEMGEAIEAGMNQMIEDGSYQEILDKWGVGDAAVERAVLNAQLNE